ncbi:MAG: cation transporter dimerization domain-containing protein [Thermodesulfobacteriota bacterium]
MNKERGGSVKFVEFHVIMDHMLSFVKSHEIAEQIVDEIKEKNKEFGSYSPRRPRQALNQVIIPCKQTIFAAAKIFVEPD